MKFYKKVEQFVIDVFTKAGGKHGIKHFIRTVYWVKVLNPKADEALLISAVAHDIERAFNKQDSCDYIKKVDKGFVSDEYLAFHQNEGARIIGDYLQQINTNKEMINRVKMLISKHEVGGNKDQNLLKDADSISFFENNIPVFLNKYVFEVGKEKVKDKFDWMFNRISSENAKQITQQWYKEAIKKLE